MTEQAGDESWAQLEAWAARQPADRSVIAQPVPIVPGVGHPGRSTFSPALAGAAEVVGLVRRLSDGQGRDDLVEQLDALREHLAVQPIRVVVIGGAGQGKSSVVNALLGATVCPVGHGGPALGGPIGMTAVPIAVSHAASYTGELIIDPIGAGRLEQTRRPVSFGEAIALATHAMNPNNQWALRQIELGVPSPTLARGIVLVDTPPISEVWSPSSTRLLRAISGAAAVILVTSASTELSAGELDLLRTCAVLCHRVVVVANGSNVFPQWASVVDRDQLLLEQRGIPARVLAVAAVPYWSEAGGSPPGPDTGMGALAAHLEESVVLDIEHHRISKALMDTFWAADRLRMRLYAERSLIGDGESIGEGDHVPDGMDDAIARLRQAAHAAQELCSPSAAWHQHLSAGLRDLRRDIEHDLDTEMARLAAEADEQVASIGISASAGEVDLWVHHRLANAVVHVHRVRKLAIRGLCKRVADQFQQDWMAIVTTLDMASDAHALVNPRLDRPAEMAEHTLADLPLVLAGEPAGVGEAAGPEAFRRWLAVTEQFLRSDVDEVLALVAEELQRRCQSRGIELHRSIIEVFTTLNVLRQLDPAMVLQRHEALDNDLEQLQSLDFRFQPNRPAPKHGY